MCPLFRAYKIIVRLLKFKLNFFGDCVGGIIITHNCYYAMEIHFNSHAFTLLPWRQVLFYLLYDVILKYAFNSKGFLAKP